MNFGILSCVVLCDLWFSDFELVDFGIWNDCFYVRNVSLRVLIWLSRLQIMVLRCNYDTDRS